MNDRLLADVERAQADADAILREVHAFCDSPKLPPSPSGIRLCSLADEIPNCEGFQKQCHELLQPKEANPPDPDSPFLRALGEALLAIAPYIGWALLIAGIGTILYFIVRLIVQRMKREDAPDEVEATAEVTVTVPTGAPPVETGSPEGILARAEEALARGDLRGALFGFLHAALRALDVRGAIRIARDRTNGEYVRSCADDAARPELRQIVNEVDVVQFGGREPEVERVRAAGHRAAMLVRGIALVVALFVLGCNQMPQQRANDPGGFEVAQELLKRQGFTLKRPSSSLARLVPPKPGETPPTLVIDTSKTPLDQDAVAGLERFVNGGGHVVLFGPTWGWPPSFRPAPKFTDLRDVVVEATLAKFDCDEATEECEERAAEALAKMHETPPQKARISHGAAFDWNQAKTKPSSVREIAVFKDDAKLTYAAFGDFGSGWILGVANADLLTNAGLARPGNPAALVAILAHTGNRELAIVDEFGGITGASNPLAALIKAGLGLPIAHVLVFATLLAFAVGARRRGPRAVPPPARRAFVEHVEATAALYAHAKASPHALSSFGRFVVERMRTRVTKGGDVASTLAHRAGATKEECQRVLDRATTVKAGDQRRGDELAALRELCDLYARAERPATLASEDR